MAASIKTIPMAAGLQPYDFAKFEAGRAENRTYWSRFGIVPDVVDKDVLDIGSGWGTLCVDVAERGARSVTGVDILENLVTFATEHTRQNYSRLPVSFTTTMPERQFDVIVSKDTFEHLMDVRAMLAVIRDRLKPGGFAYIGFAPLYHSPYGDHDRRRVAFRRFGRAGKLLAAIPWGHLFLWPLVVKHYKVQSMRDLRLNCVPFAEFEQHFKESGLEIVSLKTNVSRNPLAKLCAVLRKFKPLEKYCTNSVYCVLRKA